jgi:tripartite-type tricarboxylate transporter receptor subunit TctC
MRVRILAALLLFALAGAAATLAFPVKPVRILVGASTGGTTDTLARAVGAEMAKLLGQPVLVENRPGAGSNIAAEAVARAPADKFAAFVRQDIWRWAPVVKYSGAKAE